MAVTLDAATLATAIMADTATATRLLKVAKSLVEKYAPSAPAPVQNEATIRAAGYLNEQPMAAQSWDQVGPKMARFDAAATGALRASGGMALLSPWKVRRAL